MEPLKISQQFAMLSSHNNADEEINDKMMAQQLQSYESERQSMNQLVFSDDKKFVPLHAFTSKDVANHIKH